jgi:hypothetical protein
MRKLRAGIGIAAVGLFAGVIGCGAESGVRLTPQLQFCLGVANQSCQYYTTNSNFEIPQPDELSGQSVFDVEVQNLGEQPTEILNIYLASGSNSYVTLEWRDNDPAGNGAYVDQEAVKGCAPDLNSVQDPSVLPAPRDGSFSPCSFPMELRGVPEDSGLPEYVRALRLRYTFDPQTDTPDESPVRIVMQFAWKEDPLAPDGVINLEIPVESCSGKLGFKPKTLDFQAATSANPETQEVCLWNDGCGDITIYDIALKTPSPGDVFQLLDVPTDGTVIPPTPENSEGMVCFKAKYAPPPVQTGDPETNFIVILSSDTTQDSVAIPLTTGSCPHSYELNHTDQVDSGKSYIDFSGVVFPETAMKTITIQNTGECPITLNSMQFGKPTDSLSAGGAYWAEVKKGGTSVGFLGYPGGSALPPVVLGQSGQGMSIDIHFEPYEDQELEPTVVKLNLKTGGGLTFTETLDIQAGEPTGELALAPAASTASQTQALLSFATASAGASKFRTLTLYNKGLAPVTVTEMTLDNGFGEAPPDFKLVDDGAHVLAGQFQETTIPGLGLVSIQVEFNSVSGTFKPTGLIHVWTSEFPLGGADDTPYQVVLQGISELAGTLPVANPGSSEDYAGHTAGSTVQITGIASTGGDAPIFEQGYVWWLSAKPEGSAASLNVTGGPSATFKADVAGTYTANLVVFGVSGSDAFYSDEASVDIVVAP